MSKRETAAKGIICEIQVCKQIEGFFIKLKNEIEHPTTSDLKKYNEWYHSHIFLVSKSEHSTIYNMIIYGSIKVGDSVECYYNITECKNDIEKELKYLSIVQQEEEK